MSAIPAHLRGRLERLLAGAWPAGSLAAGGEELTRRVRRSTIAAILLANAVGVAVVVCFAIWVLPKPAGVPDGEVLLIDLAVAAGYVAVAVAVGVVYGRRLVEAGPDGTDGWLRAGAAPDPGQRLRVLQAPLRIMLVQVGLWGVATLLFATLNATWSGLLALGVGLTVALGGITTSTAAYLLAELALRPVASLALAAGPVERRLVPGVATRWLLAWALGTGAAIVGIIATGIVALGDVGIDADTLAVTMIVLGAVALVFGALVTILAAYATVAPIASIRRGIESVGEGDLDVAVAIWDATEIGLLQSGFNRMVAGLRERERIRDLFGRQVGQEAARQAIASDDLRLGGEVCHVAVLFVDVVGSTALASREEPGRVVELLNRFFGEVVEAVEDQGGWVNKFEGDAALAIFGAPTPLESPSGAALRAARELDRRLRRRLPDLGAAVGVAAGEVVAGYVGAESRFEYTVIGDPVNEAARLTELAKKRPGRVLASGATVDGAGQEAASWALGESVTVRGRTRPTRLAEPRDEAVRGPI